MVCPYASLFGDPYTGIHKTRILGFALVDTVLTVIVAAFTAWLFNANFALHLLGWLILGEILHYLFGVRTAFLEGINLLPHCARNGCAQCKKKKESNEKAS
jgi:hypothetical protein